MSLAKSSFLFTLGTFLSRISGLVRDSILSGVFGAGTAIEAFFVANRIPNLFRDMLAEGALGSSFTKIYTTLSINEQERAHRLLCDAFRFGVLILGVTSIAGYIGAPFFVEIMTMMSGQSGRPPEFYRETILLTRILFPFLGLAILAALAGGVLQQRGQFFIASVSSSALNVGYIVGSLLFAQLLVHFLPSTFDEIYLDRRVLGLALGVLLGGFLHFVVQFYFILRQLFPLVGWTFSSRLISSDLTRVFKLMAPAAIASSAGSINLLVNTNFATSLETGAVTWLNYAFRLVQLPIGIFAVAVGSVTLPALTRAIAHAGNGVDGKVREELAVSCEFISWLMIPCLAFLMVNALPTVQLLFQHGRFDLSSAEATAQALYAYSFGILGYGLIKVLTSFYYAVEKTSYAMKVSLAMVGLNVLSNAFLVERLGHVGLAATSSITLSGNALCLGWGLRRYGVRLQFRQFYTRYVWLVLGFVVALALQFELKTLLHSFPMFAHSNIKLTAMLEVVLSGALIVAIFGICVMLRLRIGPGEALMRLRQLRRRKTA